MFFISEKLKVDMVGQLIGGGGPRDLNGCEQRMVSEFSLYLYILLYLYLYLFLHLYLRDRGWVGRSVLGLSGGNQRTVSKFAGNHFSRQNTAVPSADSRTLLYKVHVLFWASNHFSRQNTAVPLLVWANCTTTVERTLPRGVMYSGDISGRQDFQILFGISEYFPPDRQWPFFFFPYHWVFRVI